MEKLDSDRMIEIIIELEELDAMLEHFEGEYIGMEDARQLVASILRKQSKLLRRVEIKENT